LDEGEGDRAGERERAGERTTRGKTMAHARRDE
jgi:hypothetical protein